MSDLATVLVIGGQGALGRLCAQALHDAGLNVIRAGRRAEDSPDFRLVDLDEPRTITDACAGVDLLVSTVRHPAHAAERTVLRDGGMLLTIASLWASDWAQLKADAAGGRGLVVLAGLAPGVYSLVLKQLLNEQPEADGLEIAGTFSVFQSSGPAGVMDFIHPAFTSSNRHPTRVFEFPAPIGRRRCLQVAGPEIGIFGDLADGRSARAYFAMIERPIQAVLLVLNGLGLLSRVPRRLATAGRRFTRGRTTTEPKRDLLLATRGARRLTGRFVEGQGDYLMTAAATVVFARALLGRQATEPRLTGVLGAEEIFELSELQSEFECGGIRILPLPS